MGTPNAHAGYGPPHARTRSASAVRKGPSMLHFASPGTACVSRPSQMVTWAGDSRTRPVPPSLPSSRVTLAPRMIGVGMLGRYYRLMHGKWSCFRDRAADPARFQVLFLLVTGSRLLNQTGSTVPAIAPNDPSPEDDRGEHAGEILQIDVRQMVMLPGSCASNASAPFACSGPETPDPHRFHRPCHRPGRP